MVPNSPVFDLTAQMRTSRGLAANGLLLLPPGSHCNFAMKGKDSIRCKPHIQNSTPSALFLDSTYMRSTTYIYTTTPL